MESKLDETKHEHAEYEHELSLETAARLQDLSMALCHYNHDVAKRALSLALGTLTAYYPEPCLHVSFDVAEAQMNYIAENIKEESEEQQDNTEEIMIDYNSTSIKN